MGRTALLTARDDTPAYDADVVSRPDFETGKITMKGEYESLMDYDT